MIHYMSKTNKTIEWFAGLFEGEGTIYRNDKKRHLFMTVGMTDGDVIRNICTVTGVGKVYERKFDGNPNHKITYAWTLSRRNDLIELANKILPYMGERRTLSIKKVIKGLSKLPEKRNLKVVSNCGFIKPTDCTSKGAKRHLNKGEKPCSDCASANRNYLRQWRLKFYKANP